MMERTAKQPEPPTILITGCSSGIGYQVAHGLKKLGWRVFATARKPEDVARLYAEGLESLALDLDDSASIQAAVANLRTRTKKLDALFNNAAYAQPGAVEDLTRDAIRAQFESNVFGTMELTNHVLKWMRAQNSGRIIQNTSVLGFIPMAYRGAYVASKYAMEGFTDTLRLELADSNIQIMTLQLGPVRTEFRNNAHRQFMDNIDAGHSTHASKYAHFIAQFKTNGQETAFMVNPDRVLKTVVKMLTEKRPSIYYRVTLPTHIFHWMKRLLPMRCIDWILIRMAKMEAEGKG
ncbi:MAG: SDR family NAD(P)-dependent oxidoreductase [Pseudomonadota bacterium]